MRKIINLTVLFSVLFVFVNYNFGQNWQKNIKQIEVLKSTLQDVEKLFGKSDMKRSQSVSLYLKEGTLIVAYSSGKCVSRQYEGWNVPEETITRLHFYPVKKRSFSALKIDKTKLKKMYDESYQIYFNEDEGVTYEVQLGKVYSIEYNPSPKHAHLKCQN